MIYNVQQRSPEWWMLRNARVTASMMWAVLKWCKTEADDSSRLTRTKIVETKKGQKEVTFSESSERANYRMRIVAQTLTGYLHNHKEDEDRWKGWDVEWGKELEDTARGHYEMKNGCFVDTMGFCTHDRIPRFGCSPDFIVGTDGIGQIKCPATTTHIQYIRDGVVPEEYEPQMMAEMSCTGRQWNDFVSFDPRLKDESLQLFVVRLNRDEKRIAEIESEVISFLAEVDEVIRKVTGKEPDMEQQLKDSLEFVLAQKRNPKEETVEAF